MRDIIVTVQWYLWDMVAVVIGAAVLAAASVTVAVIRQRRKKVRR